MNEIIEKMVDLMPMVYIASMVIVTLDFAINLYLKSKDGIRFGSRMYRTFLMEIFIPIVNTFVAMMIILIVIDDGLYKIEQHLRRKTKDL